MATPDQQSTGVIFHEAWSGRTAAPPQSDLQPADLQPGLRHKPSPPPWSVPPQALTRREVDVLCLLAMGNTNRQAADLLGLSVRTVENHRAALMDKLGAASRVEIVTYAAFHNFI